MDGRVGDAAPAHAGMRLVHHAAGAAGNYPRRSGGYEFFHGELSGAVFVGGMRSGQSAPYKDRKEKAASRRDALGSRFCPKPRCRATRKIQFGVVARRDVSRTCDSRFIRMAAWRVCGCMARWCRTPRGSQSANWILAAVENGGRVIAIERSILRRAAEYADAGAKQKYGRRLGNAAQTRARARLGDREAGNARHHSSY